MRAVTDRGHFLNFVPTALEVHRQVADGKWLLDDEIYDYIGENLHLITTPSMRYYAKAKELKNSGLPKWRDLVLNMLAPNLDAKAVEIVTKLSGDSTMTESTRVDAFRRLTGLSRATYFRYKAVLKDMA